ncbi:hypothetical protein MKX03_037527, partial [Papaver bracteatum]
EESERLFLKHIYHHSLKAFQLCLLKMKLHYYLSNEILFIFPDQKLELHTTWDLLAESTSGMARIWPESPSFNDDGFSDISSRWKGTCMEGNDFNKSDCNSLLFGINKTISPCNGLHPMFGSLQGRLARGLAKGGFPSSIIASYKVCSTGTDCSGSVILKAFDDAIKDGVHIISVSIGAVSHAKFLEDPISLGFSHVVQAGNMVIATAGNAGPNPYTVLNTSPWIMTIYAYTIDRDFGSNIVLGNKKVIQVSDLITSSFPLVFGRDVSINSNSIAAASNCATGSLDKNKVDGKII